MTSGADEVTGPARAGGAGGAPAVSRRGLLNWAVLAGVGGALTACARATPGSQAASAAAASGSPTATAQASEPGSAAASTQASSPSASPSLQVATPQNPVTWPLSPDNPAVADGAAVEQGATLQVYNYADYLDPAALKSFEAKYKKYGVKVVLSTFNDSNEALGKIRSGAVPFDVYLPSYDAIGKLVTSGLVRPLNHSLIPNIKNVWPQFQNPFYDGQWQYSVPYMVYTTGIAWRTDRVKEDIGARANPYDVFWDTAYSGKLAVLDDYREAESMVMLRQGQTDLNTGDDAALAKVKQDLLALASTTHPKVTITQYTDLPEGKLSIAQAWSGDAINMPSYLPSGKSAGILRYWFPADGRGVVNNDLMVVMRGGKNPVLAHLFLDHMLDPEVAAGNFGATGYQPPQLSIDPKKIVADGTVPANLASAVVRPEAFDTGYRTLELSPEVDAKWQAIWTQFKAGA